MTVYSPTNEWNELAAAKRSEADYQRVMAGHQPQVSDAQLKQAKHDALRAMVVGLPDALLVARRLETTDPQASEVLRQAWIGQKQPYSGTYRIADAPEAPLLRSLGLVGWVGKSDGLAVGSFGLQVRKYLIGEIEENDDA